MFFFFEKYLKLIEVAERKTFSRLKADSDDELREKDSDKLQIRCCFGNILEILGFICEIE